MLLSAAGDNNSFYKCRGPVFPAIGITLSSILQLRHRLPIILKLLCSPDALCSLTAAFSVSSVRFLTWDSQLNEPKYRVITFRLFASSDLRNAVFFCFRFAIEILDVNKKKKKIWMMLWRSLKVKRKHSNLKFLTVTFWLPFWQREKKKAINRKFPF